MIKHLEITIDGLVQGVFFRYFLKEKAEALSLVGWVENRKDGTIYIEIEGEEEKLKEFLESCYKGPVAALVEKVNFQYSDQLKNYSDFRIRFD